MQFKLFLKLIYTIMDVYSFHLGLSAIKRYSSLFGGRTVTDGKGKSLKSRLVIIPAHSEYSPLSISVKRLPCWLSGVSRIATILILKSLNAKNSSFLLGSHTHILCEYQAIAQGISELITSSDSTQFFVKSKIGGKYGEYAKRGAGFCTMRNAMGDACSRQRIPTNG